jgi:hypothetical protein
VTFAIGTFSVNGRPNNGELSLKYQTIVTPAGSAFSIWGVIFILQALWSVWQIVMPRERNSDAVYKVGYGYAVICLFQIGWTLSFSYEVIWLSLVMMYGILASLVVTTIRLQTIPKMWKGYLLWQLPFSLHCGWIIAASAVNTNVLVVATATGDVTTQLGVAYASLAVLVLVGLSWLASYPVDFAPPLVLVWALYWVYDELQEPADIILDTFTGQDIDTIQYTILGALGVIGLAVVLKAVYVFAVQRPAAIAAKQSSNGSDVAKDEVVDASEKV